VIYQVMVQMIWHHVVIENTYCLHCQNVKKVHDCTCNIHLLRATTQNEVERSQNTVKAAVFPDLNPMWKEVIHNGDDQSQPIFQYQEHQGTKHAPVKVHYLWHNFCFSPQRL
jgi:hypothetical protein